MRESDYQSGERSKHHNTNLHIVHYSKLEKGGGGVDTWMRYFIPNLLELGPWDETSLRLYSRQESPSSYSLPLQKHFRAKDAKFAGVLAPLGFISQVSREISTQSQPGDVIILVGTQVTAPVPWLLALKRRLTFVTWIRDISPYSLLSKRGRLASVVASMLEWLIFKKSDLLITNGHDTTNHYTRRFPNRRIATVPNAVDVDAISPGIPSERHTPIRVGFVGRFVLAKGAALFADAAREMAGDPSVAFHVYGPVGQDFLRQHDIKAAPISFHGPYDSAEVGTVLRNLDVIIFVNRFGTGGCAGLSHGLLEALAYGSVILAADNPIHTQVLNTSNAVLFEDSTKGLVNAINTVKEMSSDQFRQLQASARRTAEEHSIEKHIQGFLTALQSLRAK